MEGLESLSVLFKMCLQEINSLKENFKDFEEMLSCNMDKFTRKNVLNDAATLLEYDNFFTSLSIVTNLARNFNIYFLRRNEENPENTVLHKNLSDEEEIERTNHNYGNGSLLPLEMIEDRSFTAMKNCYKKLDLKEFKLGYQLTATITHIQNLNKLQFFICESNTEDAFKIQQLGKMNHLRQYFNIPSEREIFGLVLDGAIWRAIRCSSFESYEDEYQVSLLDLGETIQMNSNIIIYILPDEFKQIPAQAIPCVLMKDSSVNRIELQEQLRELEYKKVALKVAKNDGNVLYVNLMSDNDDALKFIDTNPFKADILKIIDDTPDNERHDCNGLTQEELEMLYEEPLGTSNAMKAVMGYDPQDEKRICRFYNPKTQSCFKGVNCRQEHTLMNKEGWTKDVLPANNVILTLPPLHYDVDTILSITPTYIGQFRQFYCQIDDPRVNCEPLIWTSEEISDLWSLQSAPMVFDIVLAKYKDNMWYRAKVMDVDDSGKQFKVFYIDYGNQETVHLKNLRKCEYAFARYPYQAVLSRFADFESTPRSNKKRKQAVDLLCKTLINQQLDVKVVDHSEELIVKIFDKKFNFLPQEINKIIV